MRLVAILLLGCLHAGCGGYVAVEGGTGDPVRRAPARAREISRTEAVDIAVGEARARGVRRLSVAEVEREKSHWEVELRGFLSRRREAEVLVRVDRWSPQVLSCRIESDDEGDEEQEDDD